MRARRQTRPVSSPEAISSDAHDGDLPFSFARSHHFIAIPSGMIALGWAAFSPTTAPQSILTLASYISSVPERLALIFILACVIHVIEALYMTMTFLALKRDTTAQIHVRSSVMIAYMIQTLILGYPSLIKMRQEVVNIKKMQHDKATR